MYGQRKMDATTAGRNPEAPERNRPIRTSLQKSNTPSEVDVSTPILTQCGLRNIHKNYNLPIRPSVLHEHLDRRALGETESVLLPHNKAESLFFHYFGLAQSFTHLCNLSTNKIRLSDLFQRSNVRCRNSLIGGPQSTCAWRHIV
jgi:hypothetical protein